MTELVPDESERLERAFLDANVIRGHLTTDILLSLAARRVFEPRWSQEVLDEMRRNRPPRVSEQRIDHRIAQMNRYFPRAMTTGHEALIPHMKADPKDKHVLAAAVRSGSTVLVTDNLKDFHPPSGGEYAMRLNSLSGFLSRKLQEEPVRTLQGIRDMLARNRRDPRTMPQLIDKLASMKQLRGFALKLNAAVEPHERGTAGFLTANRRGSARAAALDGVTDPPGAVSEKPANTTDKPRRSRRRQARDPGPRT